jgi:hypothetical protein
VTEYAKIIIGIPTFPVEPQPQTPDADNGASAVADSESGWADRLSAKIMISPVAQLGSAWSVHFSSIFLPGEFKSIG